LRADCLQREKRDSLRLSPFSPLPLFPLRPEDYQTSTAMQKYWTNFAKTGDPNGEGLAKWPVYAADTQWQVMHVGPEPMAAPDRHRPQDVLLDSVWGK
jgi:para-nitrobenzyl esterase